jgi:hypothetical protein
MQRSASRGCLAFSQNLTVSLLRDKRHDQPQS